LPFLQDFDQKVRSYTASLHNFTDAQVSSSLPRIYTSARHLSEEDFMRVYRAADALVIPTHGEGWGRPQLEAMAMGLPVITTNW
jgi:glycosyltransferase involved in cell wall biosynthesis